ncbi:sensor domain-containing diguanylate cyclase [Oceanirhabdus seepicola]|uniref:Diguanylate cyclase n=1 Tax=Oceanirhabdus seepicola TaxID=2828781 RepID=A0A9J6NZD1_9CLOT|nr:diguanylate cyclase [Oceanirhabdus seepicola]MCM1989257.1 diguanylate cyclase [Oceanirhabdus seepicola]
MEYGNIEIFKKYKNVLIKNAVMIFTILSLIFISIYSFIEYNRIKTDEYILKNSELNIINTEKSILNRYFNDVIGDVKYIAENYTINKEFSSKNSSFIIEQEWLMFSKTKGVYDQIRFLDKVGNEIIRVNSNNGNPMIVPKNELQNKRERYYFKDSIELKNGEIFVSKFDLNIEKGIIEVPIKPMIRFSTPIYDGESTVSGVIVLNYLASNLIEDFKRISKNGNEKIYLLNAEGYYLINNNHEKEWAFMFENKKDISFKNDFPDEWDKINKLKEGQFITENGLFTFTNTIPSDKDCIKMNSHTEGYKVVSRVSLDSNEGYCLRNEVKIIINSLYKNIYIFIAIACISSIIAALTAINKASKDKIKYFADFDIMTGVLNRRAGINKLEELFSKSKEYKNQISICFIDINGLKDVNDNLGHDAGDELIKTSVDILKKNIRDEDFIIRLGGDEFLIVFPETKYEGAEGIWCRVVEEFKKVNNEENRKYIISISHGIAEYKPQGEKYIDDLINEADKKMYDEKRKIKKDIKIIKDKFNK